MKSARAGDLGKDKEPTGPVRWVNEACFIDADRGGENMFPGKAIRRLLQRRAQNKIHGRAHQLLCLARDFEQCSRREGGRVVERHQQIHVTAGCGLATRSRTENLQATDTMLYTKRTQPLLQVSQ